MPLETQAALSPVGLARPSWPEAAVQFVLEGLAYTVEQVHGPTPEGFATVIDWLRQNEHELTDIQRLLEARQLPREMAKIVHELGGAAAFNRHVSGEQLCVGLRDLARQRWGRLAAAVLRHWGIRGTLDFGRIVFALVESGRLTKQPDDQLPDFADVYDFRRVFDQQYELDLSATRTTPEPEDAA